MNIYKKLRKALEYYRYGGFILVLQSISYDLLKRDIIIPVIEPIYRIYLKCRGNVVTYQGVKLDATNSTVSDIVGQFLASYELSEMKCVEKHFTNDLPTVEIGGGIGFISCYTNKLLTPQTKHIIIEANRELVNVIKRHKELNRCHFDIVNAAYTASGKPVNFYIRNQFLSSGTSQNENKPHKKYEKVDGVSLTEIREQFEIDEFVLLLDIEGSEYELFTKELDVLSESCTKIFVEFHDIEGRSVEDTVSSITQAGYQVIDQDDTVWVFERAE